MKKVIKKNDGIWLEIHNFCGDCGRRYVEKLDLECNDLKTVLAVVRLNYERGNMACIPCSMKRDIKKFK